MHAAVRTCVCCVQASRNADAAKSGEFLGEFSLVEFDPMGVRGLYLRLNMQVMMMNDDSDAK